MAVYKIYCDESRINEGKYKLMGGIWIQKDYGWPFVNDFHNICIKELGFVPGGHMKWSKVPSPKGDAKHLNAYARLIDLYFKYNAERRMFFRTIIADSDYDFAHAMFNKGDPEVGFYKLYYYLILNTLEVSNEYHIRLAQRSMSKKGSAKSEQSRLYDLQSCLNSGFIKKIGYASRNDVVLSIEPRPAKERILIQLADILMGAVGYHWNGLHLRPDAKAGKVILANHIARQLGVCNLQYTTFPSNREFNIFRLKPKIMAP